MAKETKRLLALEGLRGIAAIAVALFHAVMCFYPFVFYGPGPTTQNAAFEGYLYGSPLVAPLSGVFAVAIFFVLSGFVLSIGFFQTGDSNIVKKLAAKRYLRLMLPALTSVMIAWLLITGGLSQVDSAVAITGSTWLLPQWRFDPNFFDALWQGVWGAFATNKHYYNDALWTMFYELIGSFMVFGMLLLYGLHKRRWMMYLALAVFTYQTWFLPFVLGVWLADLYAQGKFVFKRPDWRLGTAFLILGLIFGGYPIGAGSTNGTFYQLFTVPVLTVEQNMSLYLSIGAVFMIMAVLTTPWLTKFLGSKRVSELGKYTFALYLVHLPIILTVCTGLFVLLVSQFGIGFHRAALISIAGTVPVAALATWLFYKYVDAPSINLASKFANWFLGIKSNVKAGQSRARRLANNPSTSAPK